MSVSAGHAYPINQPPHRGHSEPWVWGYDVSPPGLALLPQTAELPGLELEGWGWEDSGLLSETPPSDC